MSRLSLKRLRLFVPIVLAFWFAVPSVVKWNDGLRIDSSAAHAATSLPDLVVSSITNPPATAIAGTSFSVTDTTGNSGSATANASTTRYRLSLDNVITGSDSLLTGSRSVPSLKKGASSSGSVSVTIPVGQALGTYYLGACADDNAVITESNESNNCKASTTTIVVTGPPTITGLSASGGPRGMPVTITGTNFGATQGSSTVKFNNNTVTPTSWSNTSITAPVPSQMGTGLVVVTVSGVASNGITFSETYAPRVNAGSNTGYTDAGGNYWAVDDQFYGPSNLWGLSPTSTSWGTFTTTDPIANTNDPVLFQSERYGTFGFTFDVPNGRYNVTLYFAEIFSTGPNQRLFSVLIEGVPVLTNYDIFAQVGHDVATSKTFSGILVQDGQLNIDFVTVVGNAKISAIQILPDQPAKFGISSINNGTPPPATSPFPIVVQSQDSFGNPVNVSSATSFNVTRQSGTGDLTGTLSGTIPSGSSQVTLTNVNYSKAENGVILRATRTSGDNLAFGDSAPFTVVAGSPNKLGFITQPGNTVAGNNLPGPPVIAVQDNLGNTVASSTAQITVAIGTNPGGGTLSGTAQKNAVNGAGVFADLKISQPGNGYTLTASSPSLSGATSATFNLVAGGTISGTITRSGGSTPIGGASIEALQAGIVKRTAAASGSGDYTMAGLAVGSYDVRASAGGYTSQTQNGVSVTSGGTSTVNFSLAVATPTAGIVYIYDELQRLKSVIDPVGEAATYAYDAVGNLLTITRNNSSQTSVIDFNPNSGPIGSAVSIYGTGYSATPSQNAVTFNGVAATITSSTLTQIVATVPAGATNGPIAVTSPAGGATSANSFTVTGGAPGAPTIASFTPTIGVPGTVVTITGTNFDSTLTNNEVRFNPTLGVVTNASSTTIDTNFPIAGQPGKIAVSTAGGTALSAQDFFVVPAPYSIAEVESTNRLVAGGSNQTVTINTANKIGLIIFDGVAGQKLNLGITANTFPGGGTNANLYIYRPDRTLLLSRALNQFDTAIDFYVPTQGAHTIVVDPVGTSPGSVTLTLSVELNAGTVSINGASLPVTIARPGQRAYVTFSGSAGQSVSIAVTGSTFGGGGLCCPVFFLVYKPDGSVMGNHGVNDVSAVVDHLLPAAGTYTILIDPSEAVTGNLTFTLSEDVNFGGISINGPSSTVTTNRPGQRAFVTFSGVEGQKLNLGVTGNTFGGGGSCCSSAVRVLNSSGAVIVSQDMVQADYGINFSTSVAGTYTILLDPASIFTGAVTFTLSEELNAGSISSGGSANLTINRPGQRAYLTFNANQGQQAALQMSSVTFPVSTISVLKQDGTNLGSKDINTTGGVLYSSALPDPGTGTYIILVDPILAYTGSMTISFVIVNTTLSASPTTVAAGANVTATWANVPFPTGTDWIGLYAPGAADNAYLSYRYTDGAASSNVPFTIPGGTAPGTYELRLLPNNGYPRIAVSNSFTVQ